MSDVIREVDRKEKKLNEVLSVWKLRVFWYKGC